MSRRSRKRGKSGSGNKWTLGLVIAVVLMVVAIGVVQAMIRRYLQSDEFRVFLSDKVSDAIHTKGEFKQLKWDGLAVSSEGFEAEGNQLIQKLKVEGMWTEIGLGGFWRGIWEVQGFQIRQVDLELDARPTASSVAKPPGAKLEKAQSSPAKKSGWLPSEVEMQNVKIDRLSVKALMNDGSLTLKNVRLDAVPGAGRQTYDVKLTGGEIKMPNESVPLLHLDEALLKYRKGAVFINKADARFWDNSRLQMTGEWDPELNIRTAQGTVNGVTCDQVVNEDWSKRIKGKLSSDFDVVWVDDKPNASGHLVLQNGVLTALPILDIMEAYLGTTRFRVLTFNEAHTDWKWKKGQWSVSNLVVASEGLLRLEGEMTVVGENLDGHFRLGLAPGTLARIPGAEKHVFLAGERGLRWAPIRITGTLSDPKHDLTGRLLEAAGRRLLEALPEATLETLLLGKDVMDVSSQKAIQEGIKMLDGGTDLLDKISKGLLEDGLKGLLPGDKKDGAGQGLDGLGEGLLDGLLNGIK